MRIHLDSSFAVMANMDENSGSLFENREDQAGNGEARRRAPAPPGRWPAAFENVAAAEPAVAMDAKHRASGKIAAAGDLVGMAMAQEIENAASGRNCGHVGNNRQSRGFGGPCLTTDSAARPACRVRYAAAGCAFPCGRRGDAVAPASPPTMAPILALTRPAAPPCCGPSAPGRSASSHRAGWKTARWAGNPSCPGRAARGCRNRQTPGPRERHRSVSSAR